MTFEEFEELLCTIGDVRLCEGAAEHGSDDYEIKLWRCHNNSECCQVRQLYNAINQKMRVELTLARLEGENHALREVLEKGME